MGCEQPGCRVLVGSTRRGVHDRYGVLKVPASLGRIGDLVSGRSMLLESQASQGSTRKGSAGWSRLQSAWRGLLEVCLMFASQS